MWPRFGSRSKSVVLALALVTAVFVASSGSPLARSAEEIPQDLLHYGMFLGGDPSRMVDQSSSLNDGIFHGFADPETAYRAEDNGISTFVRFDGSQHIATENQALPPTEFEIIIEFRTSQAGGKLFGFEDTPVGLGTLSDRLLYVADDGRMRFVGSTGPQLSVLSIDPVTDGEWHVATARTTIVNSQAVYELFIDGILQGQSVGRSISSYPGHWRIGNGNITGYPGAIQTGYVGDVRHVVVRVPIGAGATPEPTPQPDPEPDPPTFVEPDLDFDFHHEELFIRRGPYVDVDANVDGDTLRLDISIGNLDALNNSFTTVWVVREEDGEEFMVGRGEPAMSWEGEPETSRYKVIVRQQILDEPIEDQRILASGSVPVFHQPASGAQVATAVAVTVAVAGAASAASASGTWIYELIWRFLRIVLAERLRRRTKNLDVSSIPSWAAASIAIILMALLLAVGRPGSLGLNNFLVALTVSIPAVIIFRIVTILGGYGLAYYTNQKPKYLVWAAGTVSFAITSIVLQSPIGYTGYMDRDPSTKERDARFATAGFAATLSLSGLFVMIGLLTKMSFAETGVTLTLGVLAVAMLPFPLMGGHNIWKWNRPIGVASGFIGMAPYILFQLGLLSPSGIVALGTAGLVAFAGFLIGELWLSERARMTEALAASEAAATGSSAV